MFLKEKFTPDNSLEKIKSRLVAGGHLQDRDMYDKFLTSVLIQINPTYRTYIYLCPAGDLLLLI